MNLPGREPIEDSLDNEQDEYKRMLLALALYEPRPDVAHRIKEAYDSLDWDWTKCDGCTGVSEAHSPPGTKYWPCVGHDFDCWWASLSATKKIRNWRRRQGDQRFYFGMLDFGMNPVRAWGRWVGVRTYWNICGRWLPLKEASQENPSGCSGCRGL